MESNSPGVLLIVVLYVYFAEREKKMKENESVNEQNKIRKVEKGSKGGHEYNIGEKKR